jgi:hypothetical protein
LSISKSTPKKRVARRPREKKVDPLNDLTLPTPWEGLDNHPIPLEDYAGFVYLITNLTNGRKYIGKKVLWRHSRVKVAGRQNRKRKVSPSDWTHYKGSCEELKEDIKRLGLSSFRFEILYLCNTRRALTYKELEEQVKKDVLHARLPNGEYAYYNGLISAKVYRERKGKENDDAS